MDRGRLKALFDVDERDEKTISQAFQKKAVDASKVTAFTQATAKKSKKQLEEEAAEVKRRQHEEEMAGVFEEYVADFAAVPRPRGSLGFVRAGEAITEKRTVPRGFDEDTAMKLETPAPIAKPKGKRAMDMFLEEIKRDQAIRERRLGGHSQVQGASVTSLAAREAASGSRDLGDLETTNLFVAHLPENVTEDKLGEYFGQVGEITSVKIMWPRGDARERADIAASRNKASGLSGFVSYKRRKDAEAALKEFDGISWSGAILRVGWSKAVPTSGVVLYGHRNSRSRSPSPRRSSHRPYSRSRSRSRSASYDHYRPNDHSRNRDGHEKHRHSHHHSRSHSRERSRRRDKRRRSRDSHPVSKDEEQFIGMVAAMTRAHGKSFEDSLIERERDNPQYTFLYSLRSSAGQLYEDFLDPEYSAPEGFEDEGEDAAWSTDNEEAKENERMSRNKLGSLSKKRFEAMLRSMAGKRGQVARCMAFALEHGEASSEVSNIIISSLLVDSTPVPRKMARLHLISDIVHNSAVALPSAWKYRQEFQQRLGLVFDHLSTIYHSFSGRMTAETFKRQVVAVIDVWDDRIVFPPDVTAIWRERLDGKEVVKEEVEEVQEVQIVQESPAVSRFKSAFKPVAEPDGEEDMELDNDDETAQDPEVASSRADDEEDLDGAPVIDEDVDGAPIGDEDVDGAPLDEDIDGAPLEDVDGDPVDGDDVDGNPLDVDGDPF